MAATDSIPTLKVLITMHPGMNTLDFAGPLEALSQAVHDKENKGSKAFEIQFCSATEFTTTGQGAGLRAHMDFKEAYARLKEFDVLIIPGGGVDPILKEKAEPLGLIKAYSDLQKKDPKKERTLMSVCTGSLMLAQQGILSGLSATTHPDYYAKFEKLCSEVAQRDLAERTDVVEERYVVNNLRFDLEDEAQSPYVRRKSDAKPPAMKRKGSNAWKESNTRRESTVRRAALRLGGLRVITSGGVSAGIDAALYLVSVMVNEDVANEAARVMQYNWQKGMVVDGIDI